MVIGHQCYGLCGEKCPEICEICIKVYKNIIFGKNIEYLYKTSCGHIFTLKEMDSIFETNSIKIRKCPECKQPLLFEPRYQNKIKSFYKDIHRIKKQIYDKNNGNDIISFHNEIINISQNLSNQFMNGIINIFDILEKGELDYEKFGLKQKAPISYNLIKNYSRSNIIKNVSYYNLLTLIEKFIGIEYYVYIIKQSKINEKVEFKFLQNFNIIKKYFESSKIQFNKYFFNELKRKIDNMLYYSILKMKKPEKNIGFFRHPVEKITTEDINNSYFSLYFDLKIIYKNINFETKIIFKSLDSEWYKCPNDHLYVLDEVEDWKTPSNCPYCTFTDKAIAWIKNLI